jgi:hypothetical protein
LIGATVAIFVGGVVELLSRPRPVQAPQPTDDSLDSVFDAVDEAKKFHKISVERAKDSIDKLG